jgi:hypothetical protein
MQIDPGMPDTDNLLHRYTAEHAAAAAGDAVWLDELERRRRELAAASKLIMQRIRRACCGSI